MNTLRTSFAEFVGTFFLVFAGTATLLGETLTQAGPISSVAVAFAFGLTLMVVIFATGHISGGHINPAVTIAFAVSGHFPWNRVVPYVVAQLLGATLASALLVSLFGGLDGFTVGATAPGDPISGLGSAVLIVVVVEAVATFLLMYVIMAMATDGRIEGTAAGVAIGLTITAMALGTGWISGGSFNPARSTGPAIVGGQFGTLWAYWVGPIAGALLASFAYDFARGGQPAPDPNEDEAKKAEQKEAPEKEKMEAPDNGHPAHAGDGQDGEVARV